MGNCPQTDFDLDQNRLITLLELMRRRLQSDVLAWPDQPEGVSLLLVALKCRADEQAESVLSRMLGDRGAAMALNGQPRTPTAGENLQPGPRAGVGRDEKALLWGNS